MQKFRILNGTLTKILGSVLVRALVSPSRRGGFEDAVLERCLSGGGVGGAQSCDFTAHMCKGVILSIYKLFVNPLFKLISIEHVIIGSKTQWKTI